jgi:NAD(P)-dependent dehydrogenase (short-subunit alcohol dehydrogenase family)
MGDQVACAALVTGAGKRIGRALALALARDGYDVAVHCHRSRGEAEDVGPVTAKLCVLAICGQRQRPSKRRAAVRV